MIFTFYMCGPQGEALRQQMTNALNMLKRDNRYVINAMLNSGVHVPDTVIEADLNYVPSRHEWTTSGEPRQTLYGMKAMFDSGEFSCGDAAAYEAAVQEEKYGIPTECIGVPTYNDDDYHGIYVTPYDVVDPTENWLRYWETSLGIRSDDASLRYLQQQKKLPKNKAESLGASCQIVDGRVSCEVESSTSCCVDLDAGVWRCPDPELNGRSVKISEVFRGQKSNQRWARTADGVFVPVCQGGKAWAA